MNPAEQLTHTKALCKTIGVTPKHRAPSLDEIELTTQWETLRIRAYRERVAHEFAIEQMDRAEAAKAGAE